MSTTDEYRLEGEVPLWRVPHWVERYGIDAGITGRVTASGKEFDLGLWGKRPVGETMKDWRAFRRAFAWASGMCFSHQVHGKEILNHEVPHQGWTIREGADGHISSLPNQLLLITVADCVPIYLAAPKHGVTAVLHAGWRGTAAGILGAGVAEFAARDIMSKELVMHLGVSISSVSYEVGYEVMDALGLPVDNLGRGYPDLRSILASQARSLGINEITISTHDTGTARMSFHSHRASGGTDGRMVAWIGRMG